MQTEEYFDKLILFLEKKKKKSKQRHHQTAKVKSYTTKMKENILKGLVRVE